MMNTIQKFGYEYKKFILRSKALYLAVNMAEVFFLAFILAKWVLKLDDMNTLIFVLVPVLLAPVGIALVGGYEKIKATFMKKHSLSEADFS